MTNIIDYLIWRGDLSFTASPFNEVDGAVISRIAYLPFELSGKTAGRTLGDCLGEILSGGVPPEKLLLEDDLPFMQRLKKAPRFAGALIRRFESRLDADTQTQFGAVTLDLDDGTRAAAFRGTDDTLIGWKEDLNMGFLCPVPSQTLAADFLNGERTRKALIVCGHSKGGNVAVYAASFCEERVRKRIKAIYNYDGPGFPEEILNDPLYESTVPITRTFVPQASVVGMLMGRRGDSEVVHSTQKKLLWQHDLFSWEVSGTRFVRRKALDKKSVVINKTIREWSEGLDGKQLEMFADALYRVLSSNDTSTLRQLGKNRIDAAAGALRSVKNLDEPTREALKLALQALFRCAGDEFIKNLIPAKKEIKSTEDKK